MPAFSPGPLSLGGWGLSLLGEGRTIMKGGWSVGGGAGWPLANSLVFLCRTSWAHVSVASKAELSLLGMPKAVPRRGWRLPTYTGSDWSKQTLVFPAGSEAPGCASCCLCSCEPWEGSRSSNMGMGGEVVGVQEQWQWGTQGAWGRYCLLTSVGKCQNVNNLWSLM